MFARRMDARLSAPATQRNREPILAVLRRVLPERGALPRPVWEPGAGVPSALAAILCTNMVAIAPWNATLGLLRGAAAALGAGRVLVLYGPLSLIHISEP